MASKPFKVFICWVILKQIYTYGDPPPVIRDLHLTNDLITQRASWIDLSASSITNGFEPRTKTETVLAFLRPVILNIFESSVSLAC